jgi:hypothetical protein
MKGAAMPETNVILASFFKRLEPLEEIVRTIMSHERMSALFTFRGMHEKKVLMDFTRSPARVTFDDDAASGTVYATADGRIMHEIFLNRLKPGAAVGRRELLLKGNVYAFSKVIPLFDIAPVLYREHLADINYPGFARFTGIGQPKEEIMSSQLLKGEGIPLVELSGGEKFAARVINGLAYVIGYVVGFVRYRLFKKLSVFGVLASMSRGLTAATPKEQTGG